MSGDWTIQTLVSELACRGQTPCLLSIGDNGLQQVSCIDVAEQAIAFAQGLRDWGVRTEEAVGLIAPNGPDWVIARLALGYVGAMVVGIDDLSTVAELRAIIRDASCRRILTSIAHVNVLRNIDATIQLVVLDDARVPDTIAWRTLFHPQTKPFPVLDPNGPAMLVHTSGTTGAPKAFTLSSSHLWSNVGALTAERIVGPGDRVLVPLPLHHVYPFVAGVLTVLSSGAVVVLPEGSGGSQMLRALSIAEVSVIVGVPRLLAALVSGLEARIAARGAMAAAVYRGLLNVSIRLRRDLDADVGRWLFAFVRSRLGPRLRLLVSGGARIEPEVLWALVALGLEVRSGYGLAETASTFTANLRGRERLGSEGRPFQGGEIRIAAIDDGPEGEIQVRGPCVFNGYRNNDEANRAAFTSDGWFRTGDIGQLDSKGFLYVTGRIKERIVLGGGKKVHPEELEKLYGASRYIREIAILEHDGALAALILPDFEAIREAGSPRVKDVVRVALSTTASALPPYQRLAGYRLVRQPLPRTRFGKYQRFLLPAIFTEVDAKAELPSPGAMSSSALSTEDKALLQHESARAAYELLKNRYPGKGLNLEASPQLDLGIDSLEWVAFGLVFERRLGFPLDERLAAECVTVRDLLRLTVESAAVSGHKARGELEATVRHSLEPPGPLLRAVASLIYRANARLTPVLFSLTVTGKENLPERGPFILVANHESDLDPLLIAAVLDTKPLRHTHWGGDAPRLFAPRWLHSFWRALRVFPVDERNPSESLAIAREVLRRGESLIWFPESWRSPDGRLQRFLPGIGQLLNETRTPAVPAYIEGSFEALPRGRRLPRLRRIRIAIGPPLTYDLLLAQENAPQAIADRLHDVVATLGGSIGMDR